MSLLHSGRFLMESGGERFMQEKDKLYIYIDIMY